MKKRHNNHHKQHIRNVLIFLFVIILTAIFFTSFYLQKILYNAIDALGAYMQTHSFLGALLFIILSVAAAMLSPFSTIPLVPSAIIGWGKFLTAIYLLIGWMLGAYVSYLIGFHALYAFIRRIAPWAKVQYYTKIFKKESSLGFMLLFRFAMPIELPGYVLGIVRAQLIKYLIASFLSFALFVFLTVYASEAFLAKDVRLFIPLIAIILLLNSLFFYWLWRKIRALKKK